MNLDLINKVYKFRDGYCSGYGELCSTCPYSYKNNKHGIPCKDLTIEELTDIYNELNKEDKTMTKKEEIQKEIEKTQNEIEKTQKQLAALQEKLKEAENEVPEELDISEGDKYDYVDSDGGICWTCYTYKSVDDIDRVRHRRAFLSEEYARIFAEKTQFIADMLHFKWLYDRDYKPKWDSENELSFFVYHNDKTKNFEWSYTTGYSRIIESVYFSSREVAKRCAEWLNKKYGYTKE